jgi:hypothetical protein
MQRHIKIGLIVISIGFVVSLGFFVDIVGRIQSLVERETEENPFEPETEPLFSPTDPPMAAKIFFPTAGGDVLLSYEDQTIFKSADVTNQAKQVLKFLSDGPKNQNLTPTFPQDTKVNEVFIADDGVAFVDFSNNIAANHPGGILNEQATIYSIVNSLTYNIREIQQVKILVGGTEKETLAGHLLLLLPLEMDLSISNVSPPPEVANAQ